MDIPINIKIKPRKRIQPMPLDYSPYMIERRREEFDKYVELQRKHIRYIQEKIQLEL